MKLNISFSILGLLTFVFFCSISANAQVKHCQLESFDFDGKNVVCEASPSPLNADDIKLPAVSFVDGEGLSPQNAWIQISANGVYQNDRKVNGSNRLVEVTAASLNYDPDNIGEFIKYGTEYIPRFGLSWGSRGVMAERRGGPLDRAELVMDLLKASTVAEGRDYDPVIIVGTYTMAAGHPRLDSFIEYLSADDAKLACKYLFDYGMPALINGSHNCSSISGAINDISVLHFWVEYSDNGIIKTIDPGVFNVGRTAGNSFDTIPLDAATFNASGDKQTLVSQANIGWSSNTVYPKYLNEMQQRIVDEQANYYAVHYDADPRVHFGFSKKVSKDDLLHQAQLEEQYGSRVKLGSLENGVPDHLRTKVTFGVDERGTDYPLNGVYFSAYADQIYGQIITLNNSLGINKGNKFVDTSIRFFKRGFSTVDRTITTGNFSYASDNFGNAELAFYYFVDHPYLQNNGTYADRASRKKLVSNNVHFIAFTPGDAFPTRDRLLAANRKGSGVHDFFNYVITSSQALDAFSAITNVKVIAHHHVGVVSRPGFYAALTDKFSATDIDSQLSVVANGSAFNNKELSRKFIISAMMSQIEGLMTSTSNFISPSAAKNLFTLYNVSEAAPQNFHLSSSFPNGQQNSLVLHATAENWGAVKADILQNLENMKIENGGPSYRETTAFNLKSLDFAEKYIQNGFKLYIMERPLVSGEFQAPGPSATNEGDDVLACWGENTASGRERCLTSIGGGGGGCFFIYGHESCAGLLSFFAYKESTSEFAFILGEHKGTTGALIPSLEFGDTFADKKASAIEFNVNKLTGDLEYSIPVITVGRKEDESLLSYTLLHEAPVGATSLLKDNLGFDLEWVTDPFVAFGGGKSGLDFIGAAYQLSFVDTIFDDSKIGDGTVLEVLRVVESIIKRDVHNNGIRLSYGPNNYEFFASARKPYFGIQSGMSMSGVEDHSLLSQIGVQKTTIKIESLDGDIMYFDGSPRRGDTFDFVLGARNFVTVRPTGRYTRISWTTVDNPDSDKQGLNVKKYTISNDFGFWLSVQQVDDRDDLGEMDGVYITTSDGQEARVLIDGTEELGLGRKILYSDGSTAGIYSKFLHGTFEQKTKFIDGLGNVELEVTQNLREFGARGIVTRILDASGNVTNFDIIPGYFYGSHTPSLSDKIEIFIEDGRLIETISAPYADAPVEAQ